jgi:hypothetical protein
MLKAKKYTYGTGKKKVLIAPFRGIWLIIMENDNLGEFETPQLAVDALVKGRTKKPPSGIVPSTLGLPVNFKEWRESRL